MEKDAKKLLDKYLSGNCTPEEIALLEEWYIQLPPDSDAPDYATIEESKSLVWNRLLQSRKPKISVMLKIAAVAACVILCLGIGFSLLNHKSNEQVTAKRALKDVLPGRNKAILTLADGRQINLDDVKSGQIANQNGILIRKNKNGEIEYLAQGEAAERSGSNTISTPRGGQYQISLPDGTKVWLNAATKLTYPYVFAKHERIVELDGEAYFEVFKDKTKPFRVKTARQTVEVLGTHFNINAYTDEHSIKTTLLEGAVKVSNATTAINLAPGEQSFLSSESNKLVLNIQADLDKEMAWKNNIFAFDNDDLTTVMRQISRWYDIDVVYRGTFGNEKYVGEISRSSKLSDVFEILELNHLHTEINGKVLTISGNR